MTQKELENKISEIKRDCKEREMATYRQYVKENAKYKIGDIVTDGRDTIRIATISFHLIGTCSPSIFYYGPKLTKSGEPFKDGSLSAVFESQIK